MRTTAFKHRLIQRILKAKGASPIAGKSNKYNVREIKIPQILAAMCCKTGVEIGTYKGDFAEVICKNVSGVKLYCIDPYMNYPLKQYGEKAYLFALERLAPYNCEIIKKTSIEAINDFDDESLDFVYIDGDHTFDGVIQDIIYWSRKVKVGGIVSGHDFFYRFDIGITYAVLAYTQAHNLTWYLTADKLPSWLWVKEKINNYTS